VTSDLRRTPRATHAIRSVGYSTPTASRRARPSGESSRRPLTATPRAGPSRLGSRRVSPRVVVHSRLPGPATVYNRPSRSTRPAGTMPLPTTSTISGFFYCIYLRIRAARWRECVYVLQIFFCFFLLFIRPPQKYQTTVLGNV